jgi:hypothetical protein
MRPQIHSKNELGFKKVRINDRLIFTNFDPAVRKIKDLIQFKLNKKKN